jgi:hypothetical protein
MYVSGPLHDEALSWSLRPTIAAARREHHALYTSPDDALTEENTRLRLPDDDAVCLAGLVMVEAFTPTTIDRLYTAIDSLPVKPSAYTAQTKRLVARWRSDFHSGASQVIGTFARPGNCTPNRPLADPSYAPPATREWSEEERARRLADPCTLTSDISTFMSPNGVGQSPPLRS